MNAAERQKPAPGELYLDHIAHFVPDLDAAAKLLESLGFAVTPRSDHRADGGPAGTSNRCVMLEEGYLEILAPTLDTPNARRVRALMRRYDGVHLACFGTPDAAAEQRRLAEHGFAPEPVVSLERTIEDGKLVRFSVVYVPPEKMPEGRIQYVQQLTPELLWVDRALKHQNGVVALAAVHVEAPDPVEAAARWARFSGLLPLREKDAVRLQCARGEVLFRKGDTAGISGITLKCKDPKAFVARCEKLGLPVKDYAVRLPPALGGTWRLAA